MFLNMKLLAQHTLNGFGGMGEGTSMQLARGTIEEDDLPVTLS